MTNDHLLAQCIHAGANWFGYEGEVKLLHGLWSFKMEKFLDFLINNKFNAIRIPFAAEFAFGLDHLHPDGTAVNFTENKALEASLLPHMQGQELEF